VGFKRVHPNLQLRLKSGAKLGLGVFVVSFGVAGTIITMISSTQTRVPWRFVIVAGVFCLLIGIGAAYIRGHTKLLPDSFVDEICSDGRYTCSPCSTVSLREACDMTRPYYGKEYVPAEIAEQWRLKNPKALMHILNAEGEVCAAFGVLALVDSFMDQFIEGNVTDGDLTANWIHTLEESRQAARLYLSGVVVREPSTYCGSKRARVMMWAMLEYLKKVYGLRRERTLYAIGVTKESEKLMRKLSFELVSAADHRRDERNMYRYQLSKESWERLLERVGDFSKMFTCDF
jgi:hypothetical protein